MLDASVVGGCRPEEALGSRHLFVVEQRNFDMQ
jgi:hypothetical protein